MLGSRHFDVATKSISAAIVDLNVVFRAAKGQMFYTPEHLHNATVRLFFKSLKMRQHSATTDCP